MLILKSQHFNDHELLNFATSLSTQRGSLQESLLHWDFGPIMNMSYDQDAKNYLFSAEKVPFHWDGAFYREPRLLLFYCTQSEGHGGETLFTDTEKLWQSLTESEKEACQKITLTYKTEKKAHYGGEIHIPLVQRHPITGNVILRLAEKVETHLNPVTLTIQGIERPEEFYENMVQKLYQPEFLYEHEWEAGDVVVCDNHTFLHGRRDLGDNRKRSFKRIQIL